VLTYLLVAAGLSVAGWLMLSKKPPPPPPPSVPTVVPVVEGPKPEVVPPPAPPQPAAAEAAVPARPPVEITARWKATVTRATGAAVATGSPCLVEARLAGAAERIRVPAVTVTCAGQRLYDSNDALEGMSMHGSEVEEDAGDVAGTNLYALVYEDKGTRTGKRTQVSMNGTWHVGSVWSDSAPAFHVDFAMPYQSEPVRAEPLLESTATALRRAGTVSAVSGMSPVAVGARCALRVTPIRKGEECLARLQCGGTMLYGKGTTGVAACTIVEKTIQRVLDESPTPNGGDPRIDIDPAGGKAVVSDEIGAKRWSVTVDLKEAPASN
jgi:hypothetical protein